MNGAINVPRFAEVLRVEGSAIEDFGSCAKESEDHLSGLYKLCIAPMVDE